MKVEEVAEAIKEVLSYNTFTRSRAVYKALKGVKPTRINAALAELKRKGLVVCKGESTNYSYKMVRHANDPLIRLMSSTQWCPFRGDRRVWR